MNRTIARLLPLALLLGAGCGPTVPLALTLRDATLNTAYGAPVQVVKLPPQPAGQINPKGFPGFVTPFLPPLALPAPAISAAACPGGYARQLPSHDAGNLITGPPPETSFQFTRSGSHQEGSAAPVPYSTAVTRRIANIATGQHPSQVQSPNATTDNVFTFDQLQSEGTRQTGITYWVEDGSNAGLKIAGIVSRTSPTDPNASVFQPVQPLRIANLPLGNETAATQEVASDPVHGITYNITHQTIGQVLMQTCGQAYYAWKVVVNGQYVTSDGRTSYDINAVYFVVPRLGGVIISDDVEVTNAQSPPVGTNYDDHQKDVIAQVLQGV